MLVDGGQGRVVSGERQGDGGIPPATAGRRLRWGRQAGREGQEPHPQRRRVRHPAAMPIAGWRCRCGSSYARFTVASPARCEGCARYGGYRPPLCRPGRREAEEAATHVFPASCPNAEVREFLQLGWRVVDFANQLGGVFGSFLEQIICDVLEIVGSCCGPAKSHQGRRCFWEISFSIRSATS
jgi:hypothetical protein